MKVVEEGAIVGGSCPPWFPFYAYIQYIYIYSYMQNPITTTTEMIYKKLFFKKRPNCHTFIYTHTYIYILAVVINSAVLTLKKYV